MIEVIVLAFTTFVRPAIVIVGSPCCQHLHLQAAADAVAERHLARHAFAAVMHAEGAIVETSFKAATRSTEIVCTVDLGELVISSVVAG